MKPGLLSVLSKVLPKDQADRELRWIQQELPREKWEKAVAERSQLKPLQYILGTQPFGPLTIKCKEGVLIPRNDTEEWCMDVIQCLEGTQVNNVLDYCTGSGNIALACASADANWGKIMGADFSDEAVSLAEENKADNELEGVTFEKCDLRSLEVPKSCSTFELLVSNPPYIPSDEMNISGGVEASVIKYEPWSALVGDLEFYDSLTSIIPRISAKAFVFELGYKRQAEFTRSRLPSTWQCGLRYDTSGNPRNVIGWCDSKFDALQQLLDERL